MIENHNLLFKRLPVTPIEGTLINYTLLGNFHFFFITEILMVILRITIQTFQFIHNSSHMYQKSKKSCSSDS